MYSRVFKICEPVTCRGNLASLPIALGAQDAAKTAPKADAGDSPSRWDIFAGYSYLAPKGTVEVPQTNGTVLPFEYDAVNVGGLFSASYFSTSMLAPRANSAFTSGVRETPPATLGKTER